MPGPESTIPADWIAQGDQDLQAAEILVNQNRPMSTPEFVAASKQSNKQEDNEHFKQTFEHALRARRPLQWLLRGLGAGSFGLILLFIVSKTAIPSFVLLLLIVSGLILIVNSKNLVIPQCPACQNWIQFSITGPYCPTCGNRLKTTKWVGVHCPVCKKLLNNGRLGRNYRIKYCNGCGMHLSDKGI